MPTTTKIDSYHIHYSSNSFAPRIGLYAAGKLIGQLNFKKDGATLPEDVTLQGIPWLYYHKQDFANALDILRNEKSAYIYYSGSGGGNENGLKTATPVVIAKKAAAVTRVRRAR